LDKVTKVRWVDELDRADELSEPLRVRWVVVTTEISAEQVKEFQAEDPDLGPLGLDDRRTDAFRRHPKTALR